MQLAGAEAISTAEALGRPDDRPDWPERVGGDLEDRGFGDDEVVDLLLGEHPAGQPVRVRATERGNRVGLG